MTRRRLKGIEGGKGGKGGGRRKSPQITDGMIETRELTRPVSKTKKRNAQEELPAITRELEELEQERRNNLREWRIEQRRLKDAIHELTSQAYDGVEHADVECRWAVDLEKRKARLVRTDTNETVVERDIPKEELPLFQGSEGGE